MKKPHILLFVVFALAASARADQSPTLPPNFVFEVLYLVPFMTDPFLRCSVQSRTEIRRFRDKMIILTKTGVFTVNTPKFIIESDASIVVPLIFASVLGR